MKRGKLTISIHTLVVSVSSFSFCGISEEEEWIFELQIVDHMLLLQKLVSQLQLSGCASLWNAAWTQQMGVDSWRSTEQTRHRVVPKRTCIQWNPLISNRWCCYKLIGCWKKCLALGSKTGLCWLDKPSCRRHRQQAWVELSRNSLHRCNFSCNRFVSMWIFGVNWN